MNKVAVRCWEIEHYIPETKTTHHLLITYPEGNSGHDLIICKSCGHLYAVTVAKEVYVGPPLEEKVKGMNCVNCGKLLDCNFAYYPEIYIVGGELMSYQRNSLIPIYEGSLVKEFYGIYD